MIFTEPRRLPEVNIQAELYHQCKLRGITCFLGYRVKRPGEHTCYFDAVILKDNRIACIVEVKSHLERYTVPRSRKTKQFRRYSSFGIPVLYLTRMDYMDLFFKQLTNILSTKSTTLTNSNPILTNVYK